MNLFQRIEIDVAGRVLRASDSFVERLTKKRWEVDGEPFDRRAQYMFTLGRLVERSMPDMTLPAARSYYARLSRILESTPPEVGRTEDLTIPMRSGPRPARIYYPRGADETPETRPALVYYHGGGWTIGSIETHDTLCRRLCSNARIVVVSVDYRLAPEDPFPAAVEDCYDAYLWVSDQAHTLGISARRIAVGGDSAGGNLAAVVTALARDEGKPLPSVQLLIYAGVGTVDHIGRRKPELQTGYGLDDKTTGWFFANYVPEGEDENPLVAPLHLSSHAGLSPAIVVTAQFDLLCGEGLEYVERLRAAGVPVTHLHQKDLPHGFATMSVLPRAREAISELAAALRRALPRQDEDLRAPD
jgi:acetyl esterase